MIEVLQKPPEGNAPTTPEHFKNDIGYSDAFVRRHRERIRYVVDEAVWLTFAPDRGWQRDTSESAIRGIAADFARELYAKALERAQTLDPKAGIAFVASAVSLGNLARINPMLDLARCNAEIGVRAEDLDRDEFLVGVENGVVNLRDGSFSPHSAAHLVTRRLATKFDPVATAPTFEKFLGEVQPDPEMRGFLKRWAGYCLSAAIREHVLPFHYGTGSNGKSIFLEHVLVRLMGTYGGKLSDSLVYASERGSQPFLEIVGLCGKRLAVGEENAAGAGLNENFLKSATGGDRQKGRYHYTNFVEYAPSAKLALVGNHKPRVEGRDHGFWRRFLLVDWPVKIATEKQDTTLPDKLRDELPGILNWCLAGARDWLANGLTPPASCLSATEKFREDSDSLAGFVEQFAEAADAWITKARVFDLYREWADEEGIPRNRQFTKRSLCFRLVERGWTEGRITGGQKVFVGIREVEDQP